MTASVKSEPDSTELNTQDLPTIPTIQEMRTWDNEKLLRWIRQQNPSILQYDNDLDTFTQLHLSGIGFLGCDYKFFNEVFRLSPAASLGLRGLVNAVKEGKLLPWTNSDTS